MVKVKKAQEKFEALSARYTRLAQHMHKSQIAELLNEVWEAKFELEKAEVEYSRKERGN